jgi:hypothetical protein
VSLKTLNTWVKNNSGTMKGFNSIVAQSTVATGNLAKTLSGLLNVQFHNDLLAASGASGALKTYTADLQNTHTTIAKGDSDRARLIADLKNAGLTAHQAAAYVDGLSTSLGKVPKYESTTIDISGGGSLTFSGNLTEGDKVIAAHVRALPSFAAGGLVTGGTGPTADDVLIAASKGETVLSAAQSTMLAPLLTTLGVPGYAAGGLVGSGSYGNYGSLLGSAQNIASSLVNQGASDLVSQGINHLLEVALASMLAAAPATSGTVVSWITAALKDTDTPTSWLPGLETLVSKESGGNRMAVDPILVMGEHAEGLYQMLPSTYAEYATMAGGVFNPIAEGVASIRYIKADYGSVYDIPGITGGTYKGYDDGGWLMPGATFALNQTGQPEAVTPAGTMALAVTHLAAIRGLLGALNDTSRRAPGRTANGVSQALGGVARGATYRALYSPRG